MKVHGRLHGKNLTIALLLGIGAVFLTAVMPVGKAANAEDYRLPDTGQTKCYNSAGAEITCPDPGQPLYGQDPQFPCSPLAYTDNGDGTVTDINTGLMWQQGDTQNSTKRKWQTAIDYCGDLSLAGYSDWRLPTRHELKSVVHYGKYNPAIDSKYFPACKTDDWYWSSSTYAGSTGSAWYVHFNGGHDYVSSKSTALFVRCVRAGL